MKISKEQESKVYLVAIVFFAVVRCSNHYTCNCFELLDCIWLKKQLTS